MKTFTPADANRMLPLVRSIVADILERGTELHGLSTLSRDPEHDPDVIALGKEIRALIGELRNLGCEFKDPGLERGLVDFPGEIEGAPVLLCWRDDEDSVTHYHGRDEGFAARKPIPDDLLGEA